MTSRVAILAACVAIGVSVGCRPSIPPDSDAPKEGDRGADSAQHADDALDMDALSDDDLAARIARLRDLIVPPVGAASASVSLVYGEPQVIEALPAGGKGIPAHYPMHVYDLLPAKGRAEFRALLCVTCRNDAVVWAGINHHCVIKGRRAGPRTAREERSIRAEQQGVLLDLLAIRDKFGARLETAGWAR